MEVLEIVETQLLQRRPDGSLIVESKPVLAAPGASKFVTNAFFSMSNEVNGKKNCKVVARNATWTPQAHDMTSVIVLVPQMYSSDYASAVLTLV